ncbi:hypothetical protein BGX23_000343 [Mortierella sp. AD031]|nr:hypothetical protein BGX23_000343 [Mortierella sp. AD031]
MTSVHSATPTTNSLDVPKSSISTASTTSIPASPTLLRRSAIGPLRADIFPKNIGVPSPKIRLPKISGRIESTPQLAFCINLLRPSQPHSPTSADARGTTAGLSGGSVDTDTQDWIKSTAKYPIEQDRLHCLASGLVEEFAKDPFKDSIEISEIVLLGPVLQREHYRKLLSCFIKEFDESPILDIEMLQGLVQLVQSASEGFLVADDLVKILSILRVHLEDTHQQSTDHPFHLTLAVSRLLDVMAEYEVQDLDRVEDRDPLSVIFAGLKDSSDPYLTYQALYAFQALQYVPDEETAWQAVFRHTQGIVEGTIKVSAIAKLDLGGFLEGLREIQKTLQETVEIAKSGFEGICSVFESGRGLFDSIREGLGSGYKRPWYEAVRGADVLVREGRLLDLNKLICEAACRKDPLFQWGICQLLGEIAADSVWDFATRRRAIDLIGRLYRSDQDWGQDKRVKQWMLTILCRISEMSDQAVKDPASFLLQELKDGIPNVEDALYRLTIAQLEYHQYQEHSVYIPPQAKAGLQAADSEHFPLMNEVNTFLASEKKVFLLLGDSGAGKTTFNNRLAYDLWRNYKRGGPIPLQIELPKITMPHDDMIGKQLVIYNFTPTEIMELKQYREFVLVCDGYDESQQTSNLYDTNRLNQPGQWKAKIIVSCRSQYLKQNYLNSFKPESSGWSQRIVSESFQEAVIVPFTEDQIEDYVAQFVDHPDDQCLSKDRPNWTADEYMTRFQGIQGLMGLVKNPFLLAISLQVLPQVIGTEQDLSKIRISRVILYDMFIDKWMRRGVERLQKRQHLLSMDEQTALGHLLNDRHDITRHGVKFMKKLSTSIFEEQAGSPAIEYAYLSDNTTWKAEYFSNKAGVALLREMSPLVGSGIQFRFLHRSLLEYFYSLVFYDPGESGETSGSKTATYQDLQESLKAQPLMTKSIIEEPLVVQFLAERAQSNGFLKQQLLAMMDTMETDAASIRGARNAIAVLVEAGIRFNGVDLSSIQSHWYSSSL